MPCVLGPVFKIKSFEGSHCLSKEKILLSVRLGIFRPLPPPQGASPRRSLDFGVAPVARQVNKLCKAGLISVDVRQDLLVTLLDASKGLSSNSIDNHALSGELVELIESIDYEINQQFWERICLN